jgi:hypothetical protein
MQHKNNKLLNKISTDLMLCFAEEDCVLGTLNEDCLSVDEDSLMSPVKCVSDRKRSKHTS